MYMSKNLDCHHQMNQPSRLRSRGFTLTELLIVIAIVAVLAAISFPLVTGMRERAHSAVCAQNLKQIGVGLLSYTAENSGRFPNSASSGQSSDVSHSNAICWYDAAADAMGREYEYTPKRSEWKRLPVEFGCPAGYGKAYLNDIADKGESNGWPYTGDYAANYYLGRPGSQVETMSAVKQPSATPYVQDTVCQNNFAAGIYVKGKSEETWKNNSKTADNRFADRHGGSGNILWVDGHVSPMKYSEYMDFANKPSHGGPYNFIRGNW